MSQVQLLIILAHMCHCKQWPARWKRSVGWPGPYTTEKGKKTSRRRRCYACTAPAHMFYTMRQARRRSQNRFRCCVVLHAIRFLKSEMRWIPPCCRSLSAAAVPLRIICPKSFDWRAAKKGLWKKNFCCCSSWDARRSLFTTPVINTWPALPNGPSSLLTGIITSTRQMVC